MAKRNKLVRDNIPSIIKNDGRNPITRILTRDEYVEQLEYKLQEEVMEYISDKNTDELADILEVVYSLANELGANQSQLEEIRIQKALKNGGFKDRTFLISVDE